MIEVTTGEGIGSEVTAQGKTQPLELVEAPTGRAGIDSAGDPLPAATSEIARKADAILFGTAGMPGDEIIHFAIRPGAGYTLSHGGRIEAYEQGRPQAVIPFSSP